MQLTLNFDAGLAEAYETCREYVAYRVHHQGKMMKAIAADMDLSPSDLTRKLAQSPNDSRRLTLDDLERYISVTKDVEPIKYLIEKYLADTKDEKIKALEAELKMLKAS